MYIGSDCSLSKRLAYSKASVSNLKDISTSLESESDAVSQTYPFEILSFCLVHLI